MSMEGEKCLLDKMWAFWTLATFLWFACPECPEYLDKMSAFWTLVIHLILYLDKMNEYKWMNKTLTSCKPGDPWPLPHTLMLCCYYYDHGECDFIIITTVINANVVGLSYMILHNSFLPTAFSDSRCQQSMLAYYVTQHIIVLLHITKKIITWFKMWINSKKP